MITNIDIHSSVAVYVQIENHVQFAIASGRLKPGDRLPSVRELSETVGVNPNTVAKAYRDLEVMGLVYRKTPKMSLFHSLYLPGYVAGVCVALTLLSLEYADAESLRFDPQSGVAIETESGRLLLLGRSGASAPSFGLDKRALASVAPSGYDVIESGDQFVSLRCALDMPEGPDASCLYTITLTAGEGRTDVVVGMVMSFSQPVAKDVEVTFPFRWEALGSLSPVQATCPLYNGWAKTAGLGTKPLRAEWRLGNWMTGADTAQLGLPMIHAETASAHACIATDPTFSSLFELRAQENAVTGTLSYRYLGSKVPLQGEEKRTFLFSIGTGKDTFDSSMNTFFQKILADVPAGPAWLHDIAMVYYNYLADEGYGWDKDVAELTRLLSPEERRRVALCFHGWYDGIGSYAFDQAAGKMKDEWVAMPRTRTVHFTKAEVVEMLGKTRALGFRVLWYFGDGLLQDSGGPNYHADWNLLDANGKAPRPCWTGPDTFGETFPRNPAHPDVAQWYQAYLAALLGAYGSVVDGFVWDETFYIRSGDIASQPHPAYCARSMMGLVKSLTAQVQAFDAEKVFLTSDDVGLFKKTDAVGYAMVADGNYQDSWCKPVAWSYALFPNWRNTNWSCNWFPVTHFDWTRWGVENFGTPVAISNGWEDDQGPSEWKPETRDAVLSLFRQRCSRPPVRYLNEDPANLLLSAPK